MKQKLNRCATLVCGAVLVLALLAGCSREASPPDDLAGPLSSFTADTLAGGTFTQEDVQAKDVTIVNFWGTFCRPCIAEMPDLAAYAKALPENVQLITVCLDGADNLDSAREILENAGYEGITLLGGDENFQSLCSSVQGVPTTAFFNSAGEQVGDIFLGAPADLAGAYTAAVNEVLQAEGKAEISVAVQ